MSGYQFLVPRGPGTTTQDSSEFLGDYTSIGAFTGSAPDGEECEFCDASAENFSAFDITLPLGEVGLKPALGMLVPGYLLVVTKEHMTSFAQMGGDGLKEAGLKLDAFESSAGVIFQDDYFRLEHGSDNVESCGFGSGACVTHAHQHLVPGRKAAERMRTTLDWRDIGRYDNLADFQGEPYLYLGYDKKHFIVPKPRVVSQWGRRIIAKTYGQEVWDWALYNGAAQLATTLLRLGLPPGEVIVDEQNDRITYNPREKAGNVVGRLVLLSQRSNSSG